MFESLISYILISLLILILISNAVTTKQEISILYSRIAIQGLSLTAFIAYNNLYLKPLEKGIGIYNGLFNISVFTQSFNIFLIVLALAIAILSAFYPRKIYNSYSMLSVLAYKHIFKNSKLRVSPYSDFNKESIYNRNSTQYTIIEYALVTIFVLSGAIFLTSTGDLVSLFLSIELQSYGLYILATLYRNSESSTNSGLTYFLLGGLSSCFILLGSAILYISSGTTNLDNIYIINSISEYINIYEGTLCNETMTLFSSSSNYLQGESTLQWTSNLNISSYINFSLIVLTVGFLFKISAAPFHFWSPDVYDGIPTIVTTFVAIIAKISIFAVMLELISYTDLAQASSFMTESTVKSVTQDNFTSWKNILIFSSLMSLIIGSILGLTQHRIKRLFAYSTISHVGFILLALCVNKMESIQGYIFYILQYSLSNLNAFFILVAIGYTSYNYRYNANNYLSRIVGNSTGSVKKDESLGNRSLKLIDPDNSPIQLLNQLKGYFYVNSFLSLSFAITLFSFVGIPPLIGFFAKQMVLSAALDEGYVFMTLVGVITSVIGAVYYLNIIKLIFFSKSDYVRYKLSTRWALSERKGWHEANDLQDVKGSSYYINDGLSIIISILTMAISLFIFVPGEWFRIVSIISLSLT